MVNCRSIVGKGPDLSVAVDYIQPDAIIRCESWLDTDINNSEIFPDNFTVFRKDRNRQGGGVFLAIQRQIFPVRLCGQGCLFCTARIYSLALTTDHHQSQMRG